MAAYIQHINLKTSQQYTILLGAALLTVRILCMLAFLDASSNYSYCGTLKNPSK